MAKLKGKTNPQPDLVTKTRAALAREAARRDEAQGELREVEAEVDALDVDDHAFVGVIARRDAARARLEALAPRVMRAEGDLEVAQAAAAAETQAERRTGQTGSSRAIAAADPKITARFVQATEETLAEAPAQAGRCAELERLGGSAPPTRGHGTKRFRAFPDGEGCRRSRARAG